MNEMRRHPIFGYKVLRDAEQLTDECKSIVLQHHERNDGTGYPKGLRGDEIHLYGKICSLADVYDALTSERPYRSPLTHWEAVAEIRQGDGSQFDPAVVAHFLTIPRTKLEAIAAHWRDVAAVAPGAEAAYVAPVAVS